MTTPTGNGESRGPESAGSMGTPLPGSRPSRAAATKERKPAANTSFSSAEPSTHDAGGRMSTSTSAPAPAGGGQAPTSPAIPGGGSVPCDPGGGGGGGP